MKTNESIFVKCNFTISEIAKRIVSGEERIIIKEAKSAVTECCPDCGEPILTHPLDGYWTESIDDERIDWLGNYMFKDGDCIFIKEVYDSYHDGSYRYLDCDATLMAGDCFFCGKNFGTVEIFCLSHVPHPNEGAKGDPNYCAISNCYPETMIRSRDERTLCLVCLGENPIGVMIYGKNVLFPKETFAGYPAEDFVSDCCAFYLDCLGTNRVLDGFPCGVICTYEDTNSNNIENDWVAASVVAKALYQAGKHYMGQDCDWL